MIGLPTDALPLIRGVQLVISGYSGYSKGKRRETDLAVRQEIIRAIGRVHTHMTNSRLTDPEVLEWRFPVRLERFEIRHGSGGKGAHQGGAGVHRAIRFLEPMTVSILSGHRRIAPYGMAGGDPGQVGRNWIDRADGSNEDLAASDRCEVKAGDVIVVETPGGGGFGSPGKYPVA